MLTQTRQANSLDFLAPLGLMLPISVADVNQAYLAKVKTTHPDAGGNAKRFNEVQTAYEKARKYAETHSLGWIGRAVELYVAGRHLVDQVKQLGGSVDIEVAKWLKLEVGEDFVHIFEKAVGIHLRGRQIDDVTLDAVLQNRQAVAGVRLLEITHTRVTLDGLLRLLRRLIKLESLWLNGTDMTWWQRRKLKRSFPVVEIVTLTDQRKESCELLSH